MELRVALSLLALALASIFSDPWPLLLWIATILAWEFVLAPAARRPLAPPGRIAWRDALALFGACLYGAFPFLVYDQGGAAGVVMAVAWMGGAAIHIFIRVGRNPRRLLFVLAPSLVAAIAVPWLLWEASLLTLMVAATTLSLIASACAIIVVRGAPAREAEHVARIRSRILAAMTHDLHAPLQTIVHQSETLIHDLGDAGAVSAARQIKEAGDELLTLVRRADEVSRLAEGQIASERVEADLDCFMHDIVLQLTPAAERHGDSIEVAIWSEQGRFRIDADNVRRCLLCVGENAIEFTRNGFIQLGVRHSGDWLEFTIEDTGARLSAEAQAQLRALLRGGSSAADAHEGLGLGLALSAGLARLMRADMSVSSAHGQGAAFTLRVPIAP